MNIICPIHGKFEQRVADHLNGIGCPYCSSNSRSNTKEFINKNENENLTKLIQYDVLSASTLEQILKAIDEIGYVDLLGVKKLISNKIGENQI